MFFTSVLLLHCFTIIVVMMMMMMVGFVCSFVCEALWVVFLGVKGAIQIKFHLI